MARSVCVGLGLRGAGAARGAGQVARAVRAAGCCSLRKVCRQSLAKNRELAEKEAGVFGRDAWAGGSGAGEKADGSVVRAVLGAWGWAGSLRLLSRHGLFRATLHSRKSGSREVDIHWTTQLCG